MRLLGRSLPVVLALSIALAASRSTAQFFTNLNFESGLRQPLSGVYTLPGWTVSPFFQGPHIGTVHVLYPSAAIPEWQPVFSPNSNLYSLTMQVGMDFLNPNAPQGVLLVPSISQTALIPASAQSIRFRATIPDAYHLYYRHGPPPNGDPDVYLPSQLLAWALAVDGHSYPLHRLGDDFWGMNIPGHAGQVRTLSIAMNPDYKPFGLEWPTSVFDDISFSSQRVVPEPSTAALAFVALSFCTVMARERRVVGRT
jgi:hypothetical protein